MPHTAQWIIDKRVLLIKVSGNVDKAELGAMNEDLTRFVAEGHAPVHLISDNSEMAQIPFDIKTFRATFSVLSHSKWGMTTVIGANSMVQFFGQLVSSSFRMNVRMVKTLADAKTHLQQQDDSLLSDWLE